MTHASDGDEIDPISLEILRNQLKGIAEEMEQVLIRGASSPNVKERQDCSTALFDDTGWMIAQAEHIPVHLGAMLEAVATVREHDPNPGDAYILNDPFTGGTHLPDVTVVSTIAPQDEIIGYAVTRAHHAHVGGSTPGSMPAGATEIYQEGIRIPAIRLVDAGNLNEQLFNTILTNVRNSAERRADLQAQLAANDRGEERLGELLETHGRDRLQAAFTAVLDYSRERIEAEIADIPAGIYRATDVLESDGVTEEDFPIVATVTVDARTITIDFDGTAEQVAGKMNAPPAVATSAVYFVVRSVTDPEIPPNQGCYDPITVKVSAGTLLNPPPSAAVVGRNIETSQRVTDIVLQAFGEALPEEVPAQGQGTMNNTIIGSRTGDGFTYYETIGGAGAGPETDGMDGVQLGMRNTLNTPIETLEAEYPLSVDRYALRSGSGGDGKHRG